MSADLFAASSTSTDGLPADIAAGLERLAASAPIWSQLDQARWREVVAVVDAFARRWDGLARALGWSSLQLYGLHQLAPWSRMDAMGAAFLAARSGHTVVAVESGHILTASPTGARLRIYRCAPHPEAVLAWELCGAPTSGREELPARRRYT